MVKYTEMAPDRFKDFWKGPLFGQSATASDAGRPYLAATRVLAFDMHHKGGALVERFVAKQNGYLAALLAKRAA